jgi:hypothetical protein
VGTRGSAGRLVNPVKNLDPRGFGMKNEMGAEAGDCRT